MFPFGLFCTGALAVLIVCGVLDPRKLGISRVFAAVTAGALFVGYFFPPLIVGDWEFNVAGLAVPLAFGAALCYRAPAREVLTTAVTAALVVWAAAQIEAYAYGWLLLIAAVAAAVLTATAWLLTQHGRGSLAGLCLGAVAGEALRCWTEIARDGVLITECGMGRYFDVLLLAVIGVAVLLPLAASQKRRRV